MWYEVMFRLKCSCSNRKHKIASSFRKVPTCTLLEDAYKVYQIRQCSEQVAKIAYRAIIVANTNAARAPAPIKALPEGRAEARGREPRRPREFWRSKGRKFPYRKVGCFWEVGLLLAEARVVLGLVESEGVEPVLRAADPGLTRLRRSHDDLFGPTQPSNGSRLRGSPLLVRPLRVGKPSQIVRSKVGQGYANEASY